MQPEQAPTHRLLRGSAPLLVSIPHLGQEIPDALRDGYAEEALRLADTDWHLDRLYDFAAELGASVLTARVSRYVIDLNRPPDGSSLYPGQTTTELCPSDTFRGVPLYRPGARPSPADVEARRLAYWEPYHQALRTELARLRELHPHVLLWEAHSIAGVLPRLFEGKLPDLNFGTDCGRACDVALFESVLGSLPRPACYTHAVNGRFKGGYITRRYGDPAGGVSAVQLEMCQSLYMNEQEPFDYLPERAAQVRPTLRALLEGGLHHLGRCRSEATHVQGRSNA